MAEITDSRLEKLASKAADRALKSMGGNGVSYEAPSTNSFSYDDNEVEDGEAIAAFDIFDWCDETTKKGHQIQYVIKRNGEMLTTKYHPYSWEQVQKEFRGGQYQVVAKSLTTKRYLKSETRTLSDPIRGTENVDMEMNPKTVTLQAPTPQGPNFMEMFTLMQSMSEKQRAESREVAKENAQISQQNMLAFVEMMKSSQTGSQQMFYEIAKMTQQVSEKLAESQRAMFEKMESRFEKILDKVSDPGRAKPEKSEFGLLDLLKMQQESQEKGFQLFNQLSQIAEQKASERLELIEELKGDGSQAPVREKSMTDTLIETMLPTIAGAIASQGQVPAAVGSLPQPPVRRSLPAAQGRAVTHAPRPAESRSTASVAQTQTVSKAKATPTQTASAVSRVGGGTVSGENAVKRNALGLPVAHVEAKPAAVVVETSVAAPTANLKDKYTELLVPVFAEHLLEQAQPDRAATAAIATLNQNGHTVEEFVQTVSKADLMGVVLTFGLPDEANPWFEEVYAHISSTAGVVAR